MANSPILAFVHTPKMAAFVTECAKELGLKLEFPKLPLKNIGPEGWDEIRLVVVKDHDYADELPWILRRRAIVLRESFNSDDELRYQKLGYRYVCKPGELKERIREILAPHLAPDAGRAGLDGAII